MKICPKCGKTYNDQSLNFCLEDGSVLNQTDAGSSPLPKTVLINQPPATGYEQPFGRPTEPQNQFVPAAVNNAPVKKARTWLWVVGILGTVVVLCGGGLTGLLLLGSISNDNTKWNSNFGSNLTNVNTNRALNSKNSDEDLKSGVTKVDLSKWVQENSQYGKTEFKNDELFSNAIKNNFYYVLVAPAIYKSANATTKITVRDAESGNNSLGYGLIINSNPTPLIKDYAFLINTRTLKYRIVSHSPGKEQVIVNWKSSSSIKGGIQANVLEVKDEGGKLSFFINGELAETVTGKDGYADGVPGIYVGGTSPIAFSNLEIRK